MRSRIYAFIEAVIGAKGVELPPHRTDDGRLRHGPNYYHAERDVRLLVGDLVFRLPGTVR